MSVTVAILTHYIFCYCTSPISPGRMSISQDMSMSSPPPPDCHATMCGEVSCVGHGCVSIPLIVLLCCCAFYGRRRRDLQRIERLERAQAGIVAARGDHYYYANQAGCQPGYIQPGCVAQQSGYVVQQPGCIVQQPGCIVASQPMVVTAQPVTSQAPQLAAVGEKEVPMGLPVS